MLSLLLVAAVFPGASAQDVFQSDVAPLLEQRCVACHSVDEAKGGLSLSSRASALIGGDSGPVLVPGQPEASPLIEAVSGPKPDMPERGEPLSASEIAILRTWIEAGAPWPEGVTLVANEDADTWWSLQPLLRPEVPVLDSAWVTNEVDAFVLAELQERGLTPSIEADRRTLIRRVSYDLTGLPPTESEVAEFVANKNKNAYGQLVERLLGSQRYGERWGRRWLDVAHYADTHGFDKDKPRRNAWPYRDWVIEALNDDLPWSRFLQMQIAGDQLEPDDADALAATGFVVAGPWDFVGQMELREGTRDKDITRNLDRDDMVASTLNTFASTTVQCARCHDHKFDPVSQEDYYGLQAVFAGVERADRLLDVDPAVRARRVELEARKAQLTVELSALPGASSATNGWHSTLEGRPDATKWVQLDLKEARDMERIVLVPARPVDFADTPGFGFPVRFRVELADDVDFLEPRVILDHSAADYVNPGDVPVVIEIDEVEAAVRARYLRITATRLFERSSDWIFALSEVQVFEGGQNVAGGADVSALDSIEGGLWSMRHLVDGYSSRALLGDAEGLEDVSLAALRARLTADLAQTEAETSGLPAPFAVYAVTPREPRPVHVLHRGEVDALREKARPGALSEVPGPAAAFELVDSNQEGQRRLALARWLADPENPLSWRSAANRIWLGHFGRGIVTTPSDFGRMGALPTHPALLDWLAAELRSGVQSQKELHRLIVLSSTYRQSSSIDPQRAALDEENRFLWRMNRQRLDAEELRDTLLSLSGELDLTMGGPAFETFAFEDDHSPRYIYERKDVDDPSALRRSVYRFLVRSAPDPWMETFDCADPSMHVAVRAETTTPLQALALLNDSFLLRRVEHFADRAGDVQRAFELVFLRAPESDELAALEIYAAAHGLPNLCRVLFNANELVYID
ncbi:MAG: mono/diheme cytochrome c family protein [Planctomycetota bacterium]|jgi:mono/diheme cytochrome c family protein